MMKAGGFTLVELMITIVIATILLTVGVPSFMEFTRNNQLIAQTNELVTGFNYARSEAIKEARNTTICVSNNQATCSGGDWSDGWLVWVDLNNDGAMNAGEERRVGQAIPASMTITSTSNSFQFDARGNLNAPANGTFTFCDDRSGETGRALNINATGRLWLNRDFGCT